MSKHHDLYHMAQDKDNGDVLCCAVAKILDKMESTNPALYAECVQYLEDVAFSISKDEAVKIVRAMEPYGQKWSYNDVEKYLTEKGIEGQTCDYYLCMNMAYNDYHDTASMYSLENDTEFYFSLAKDFIDDPDAKPHKIAKYFCD